MFDELIRSTKRLQSWVARHPDACRAHQRPATLDGATAAEADTLDHALRFALTRERADLLFDAMLKTVLAEPILAWAHWSLLDPGIDLTHVVAGASMIPALVERAARFGRERILCGPAGDARRLIPLVYRAGTKGTVDPQCDAIRDLLLWCTCTPADAPRFVAWLFEEPGLYAALVKRRIRGSLWERALAARLLLAAARGLRRGQQAHNDLEVDLAELSRHPSPEVWVPACLALGEAASRVPALDARLFRWLHAGNLGASRRAVTALFATSSQRVNPALLQGQLLLLLKRGAEPGARAALGLSAPSLGWNSPDLWAKLISEAEVLLRAPPGNDDELAFMSLSLAEGIVALDERVRCQGDLLDDGTRSFVRVLDARAEAGLNSGAVSSMQALERWHRVRALLSGTMGRARPAWDVDGRLRDAAQEALAHPQRDVRERVRAILSDLVTAIPTAVPNLARGRALQDVGQARATLGSVERAAGLSVWRPLLAAAGGGAQDEDELVEPALKALQSALRKGFLPETSSFAQRATFFSFNAALCDRAAASSRSLGGARSAALGASISTLDGAAWLTAKEARAWRKPIAELLWRLLDAVAGRSRAPQDVVAGVALWWRLRGGSPTILKLLERADHDRELVLHETQRQAIDALMQRLDDPRGNGAAEAEVVDRALAACGAELSPLGMLLTAWNEHLWTLYDTSRTGQVRGGALAELGRVALALETLWSDPVAALRPGLGALQALNARGVSTPAAAIQSTDAEKRLGRVLGRVLVKALDYEATWHDTFSARAVVGDWYLLEQLGEGGMATVWRVRHRFYGHIAVMKRIHRGQRAPSEPLIEAIRRESDILSRVSHPNLVAFLDAGEEHGWPWVVVRLEDGCDLDELMKRRAARQQNIRWDETNLMVQHAVSALRCLHAQGIVHCDLKPENIMVRFARKPDGGAATVSADDNPILGFGLLDFGIAYHATQAFGDYRGTLGFMAPELARGDAHVTPKADVYGIAATVYAVLTDGEGFFKPGAHAATLARGDHALVMHYLENHRTCSPMSAPGAAASLEPELVQLLAEATALDPQERLTLDAFAHRFAAITASRAGASAQSATTATTASRATTPPASQPSVTRPSARRGATLEYGKRPNVRHREE